MQRGVTYRAARYSPSMKIAAVRRQPAEQFAVIDQMAGDQMPDLALALPDAIHTQQRRIEQFLALPLNQPRPDDDIDGAGFIFQRNENGAVGSTGPLPH